MENGQNNQLAVFEQQHIRSLEHEGEMWFSVSDIIGILSESKDSKAYWRQLKKRESQLVTICHGLKLQSNDGKMRVEDCANTEGVLRLIQSVPSPKAEPFKMWLARLGKENLEETADSELGFEWLTELYKSKGYSEEWIKNRLKSIEIRRQLTDEWKNRGLTEGVEYAQLTAEIAKGTFGLTPSEHAHFKGLKKQNLRDHMNNLELIFTALSEEVTRQVAIKDDTQGFDENREAAQYGGSIAGNARERLEKEKGIKVVAATNFLNGGDAAALLTENTEGGKND